MIEGGSICHMYMCIVLYIYRSAISCAKFGVAVLKASMFNSRGQSAMGMYLHCTIYETYVV